MFIPFCILGGLAGRSSDRFSTGVAWVDVMLVELRWFALLACVPVGNGNSESTELQLCNSCVTWPTALELLW